MTSTAVGLSQILKAQSHDWQHRPGQASWLISNSESIKFEIGHFSVETIIDKGSDRGLSSSSINWLHISNKQQSKKNEKQQSNMSNLIITNTPNANNTNPEAEPGMDTEMVTPSTMKKRSKCNKGKIPFHFDSSLTQVSAAAKGATDAPDDWEEDCGWKEDQCNDKIAGSGRTSQTNGTKNKSNIQDKNNKDNEYKAEGCFTKAYIVLSMGCNMIQVGNKAKNFFFSIMLGKDKHYPEDQIRIIENQPNPFPWIAVLAPKNKVMVLHSIWHFTAPFEYYHPNDGNMIHLKKMASWQSTRFPSTCLKM